MSFCPECKKKMQFIYENEQGEFICECGYRIKIDSTKVKL